MKRKSPSLQNMTPESLTKTENKSDAEWTCSLWSLGSVDEIDGGERMAVPHPTGFLFHALPHSWAAAPPSTSPRVTCKTARHTH